MPALSADMTCGAWIAEGCLACDGACRGAPVVVLLASVFSLPVAVGGPACVAGLTTLVGGGTGPAHGTLATTCTPGPVHMAMMLRATDSIPLNLGFTGKVPPQNPLPSCRLTLGRLFHPGTPGPQETCLLYPWIGLALAFSAHSPTLQHQQAH